MMRRNLEEVVASQRKMIERRKTKGARMTDEQIRRALERQLVQATAYLRNKPNFRVLDVDYNDLLANPETEIDRLRQFLGAEATSETLAQVIEPTLWRNRASWPVGPSARAVSAGIHPGKRQPAVNWSPVPTLRPLSSLRLPGLPRTPGKPPDLPRLPLGR
ncbi:MAG: sulfotransferase [Bryobacterales bacterium]